MSIFSCFINASLYISTLSLSVSRFYSEWCSSKMSHVCTQKDDSIFENYYQSLVAMSDTIHTIVLLLLLQAIRVRITLIKKRNRIQLQLIPIQYLSSLSNVLRRLFIRSLIEISDPGTYWQSYLQSPSNNFPGTWIDTPI